MMAPCVALWRGPFLMAFGLARGKREGLRLRFHDLRHTAITNLSESLEVSKLTIMSMAGHLSRKMLEHYSHIRLQAKRRALDTTAAQPLLALIESDVNQNVNQQPESNSKASAKSLMSGLRHR